MNQLVVPQVYTIASFGASMFLWPYLPSVRLEELFLMLSTVVVWVMAMPISSYKLRKQKISLTQSIVQNWFIVSLASATVIVAISGCIFYSESFHFEMYHDDLVGLPALRPPNPFALINGVGILYCEATWVAIGIFKMTVKVRGILQRRSIVVARGESNFSGV